MKRQVPQIEAWQQQVDQLDRKILELLNRRLTLTAAGQELRRDARADEAMSLWESNTTERLSAVNAGPVRAETLRSIYRELQTASLAARRKLTVAFFGPSGTFTHQAALAKFGNGVHYLSRPTIPDVFDAVARKQATFGVVPVENSTEGAVTHTLDMFADVNVRICAEANMVIHHHLLCRCRKEELQVVYSHPQVLGQCRKWLRLNLPQVPLVEALSTTEAASRCAAEESAGALAGALAAELYNLPICDSNIEDLAGNLTRFLVIGDQETAPTGNDKTSLLFGVKDRVGALLDSLEPFRQHEISLTFIESRPSRRKTWEYHFYVDFLGHVSDPAIRQALDELGEHCQYVKILGSYPRAGEPVN